MAAPRTLLSRYMAGPVLLTFITCFLGLATVSESALTVSNVNENSMTVNWIAIENVTEYNVSYTNGSASNDITVTGTQYIMMDLQPGVTYNITVSYKDASNISQSMTTSETTLPSIVTGLKASGRTETSVALLWDTSKDAFASDYSYTVKIDGGRDITGIKSNNTVVPDLLPGKEYSFTVSAVTNNVINSRPSAAIRETTLPSIVTGLNASNIKDTSMTLEWTPSNDTMNTTYTYTVQVVGNGTNFTDIKGSRTELTGLSPGVEYSLIVYAVTQNKISSQPSMALNVTTLPSIVTGLNASNVRETSMTLEWTPSKDTMSITYTYTVEIAGNGTFVTDIKGSRTELTGLSPGVEYSLIVYAVTQNKNSSRPSMALKVTTLPSVVDGLKALNVKENNLTLEWNSSHDKYASLYTYTVQIFGNGTNVTHITDNHKVISDLLPGVEYSFIVYAVTQNGTYSRPSTAVTNTTLPSVVYGLKALDVMENNLTLQWNSSLDEYASLYTYTVQVFGNGTYFTNITANHTVIPNLLPGVEYSFIVYAVTQNGTYSRPSATLKRTTLPLPVTVLKASNITETSLTLEWSSSIGPLASNYTYTVNIVTDRRNISGIKDNVTPVTGLLPGVDYSFIVYAVTGNEIYSLASNTFNTTTSPSVVPVLNKVSISNNSVTINWTSPNNINVATYKYLVEVELNSVTYNSSNTTELTQEVKNLSAGETYSFRIYTLTRNGVRSLTFSSITVTTMPNGPQNLVGTADSVSEITVNWAAPGDRNAKLYTYWLRWENAKLGLSGVINTMSTNASIRDLSPGNQYKISVASIISNTSSDLAVISQLTEPLPIDKLVLAEITNATATLKWEQSSSTVNSSLSGYFIQVRVNGHSAGSQTKPPSDKTVVLDGLEAGTSYEFIVQSFASPPQSRSDGISPDSTYGTPLIINAETVPNPVGGAKCIKVDGYQIKVQFTCPTGNFSAIQILVNGEARGDKITACASDYTAEVKGLQPAKTYSIDVQTLATSKSFVTSVSDCFTDSTAVIVGSVLGILLFLLLIGVIVFFVMRNRRSKEKSDTGVNIPQIRFHTISKEKFPLHYNKKHADSDFGFAEEYQELNSAGLSQSKKAAELPENRAKNRFTNVLPYDHSRVKLCIIDGMSTTDYINANYMPGYNSTKEFIASQGPLPNTTADFWRMVWEHHIDTIVMLTNCMENGRVKCERYWPLDYTPCTYGDITVTVTSETILHEWTIRDFSIKNAKQPQQGSKNIRHFHFTAWPDHGVPDSTSSIVKFRNLVREHMDQRKSTGPTIVHCSAGVGRTGTLIALDYLIQQMEREHRIGVYGFVNKMRLNRPLMVQTEAQYIFLNKCMLDLLEQPPEDEPIYENQGGPELIYENAAVVRNFQKENP